MKTKAILEVPVFGVDKNRFEHFFGSTEKVYNDFILKEYELDSSHVIYFYFMDNIPEPGSISLMDQIIPKAPFTFFLIESEESMQEKATQDLFSNYTKEYSTPVFLIVDKDTLDFNTQLEDDPVIKANNFEIILVENNNKQISKTVVIEAINKVTPVNI
jgi:hypothetical protein